MALENKFNPSVVYIPLTDSKAKLASVKAEVGSEVKVGTLVAEKYHGKEKTPVFASVSGRVTALENRTDVDGNEVRHLVIANDGKYTRDDSVKPLAEGESLKDKLNSLGIKNLDNTGIYTGLHYDNVTAIYVDAIYPNEPEVKPSYDVLNERSEKVVAATARYATELNVPAYIVVSKNVPASVLANLNAEAAKTSNVKILVQKPYAGWQYKLVRKAHNVELSVDTFRGIVVVSISTMAAVADAIIEGLPVVEKGVTLCSDVTANGFVVCPIGTPITDLVEIEGRVVVTSGGLLNGKTIVSNTTVISTSLYSLNIMKPLCEDGNDCVSCGLCNDVCPVGILPSEVIFADNLKDEDKLKQLHLERCIECGKCSFVCPTRVNVLERVRRAKRRLQ